MDAEERRAMGEMKKSEMVCTRERVGSREGREEAKQISKKERWRLNRWVTVEVTITFVLMPTLMM